jgi:hypothetical protein
MRLIMHIMTASISPAYDFVLLLQCCTCRVWVAYRSFILCCMFKAITLLIALKASSTTVAASEAPSPAFFPVLCIGTEIMPMRIIIAGRADDKIRASAQYCVKPTTNDPIKVAVVESVIPTFSDIASKSS